MDPHRNLSFYAVDTDRWDHRVASRVLEQDKDFAKEAKLLGRTVETADELWIDTFQEFYKADPRLLDQDEIRPSHVVDRAIMESMEQVHHYKKLREFCMGDPFASADACISMRPTLEAIWDRLESARKAAERRQELMEQLAKEMAERMEEQGGSLSDEEMEALKQAIAEAEQEMQDELDKESSLMRAELDQGMEEAAGEAEALSMIQSLTWGDGAGSKRPLSYAERRALAELVNNERVRSAFDLVGAMKANLKALSRERIVEGVEEIIDMDIGQDLDLVPPSDLAMLNHPLARLKFFKDFRGESLRQYDTLGHEPVAQGDIICLVDVSGSMSGDRDRWAKAVALTLLHVAHTQNRGFRGILFDTNVEEFDFADKDGFTPEKVADFICSFSGGGTHFMPPLDLAKRRIQEEVSRTGVTKADVVFITDGESHVDDEWFVNFKKQQQVLDFYIWGISLNPIREGSVLNRICDNRVITVNDLRSGDDLTALWQGITQRKPERRER